MVEVDIVYRQGVRDYVYIDDIPYRVKWTGGSPHCDCDGLTIWLDPEKTGPEPMGNAHWQSVTSGSCDWPSAGSPLPLGGVPPRLGRIGKSKIKCWYCGGANYVDDLKCRHCGAPLVNE